MDFLSLQGLYQLFFIGNLMLGCGEVRFQYANLELCAGGRLGKSVGGVPFLQQSLLKFFDELLLLIQPSSLAFQSFIHYPLYFPRLSSLAPSKSHPNILLYPRIHGVRLVNLLPIQFVVAHEAFPANHLILFLPNLLTS